tara:strand:+ start:1002 stop:1193 length:192 start_codon:yes stop_codon:yes gene_type:complete
LEKQGEKDSKRFKNGHQKLTKNIHDTLTIHTIPHLVSEFFISDATCGIWEKMCDDVHPPLDGS